MIYDDVSELIGRTPVVRINRLAPAHVEMYVKLEAANPGGSVKDRLALGIVLDAERRGVLTAGQTVIEATSGNTGIALAMVCAARGYRFVAVMPESFSVERRQIMRAYGAKVLLTPAAERASGAVRLASRLAEERGWFLARQFDNEANPAFHRQTQWLADACRANPPRPGVERVRLPGENAMKLRREAMQSGVVLSQAILGAIEPHAARLGLAMPA